MESLHEAKGDGVLSRIIQTLSFKNLSIERKKQKDKLKAYRDENPYLGGDISKYSKDLIMTFPVMFDSSLPAKTASLINKANERNIIAMLQLLFASVMKQSGTGKDYLAKFHKNISTNTSIYDVLDVADKMVDTMSATPSATDTSATSEAVLTPKERDMFKSLIESCRLYMNSLKSYPVESLNETSLNDYLVYESQYGINVHKQPKETTSVNEAFPMIFGGKGNEDFNSGKTRAELAEEEKKDQEEKAKQDAKDRKDHKKDDSDILTKDAEYMTKMLLSNEVKKANEVAPSLLLVKYKDEAGDPSTFVAGVKSRLIAVDAADIVDRLAAKNKTAFTFKNFIRATTGEIGFIKDFILSLDQAKIDAKNAVKKGPAAKMWNVLEYRGAKNSAHKLKKADNDASAITVLTINQETVNILKNNYRINIEDPRVAKQYMDIYNLLGIVICDESIEVAKFLYSGNDQFEQYAYSFLSDSKSGIDDSYKKIIDALAYRR